MTGRIRFIIGWTDLRWPSKPDALAVMFGYVGFVLIAVAVTLVADILTSTPSASHPVSTAAGEGGLPLWQIATMVGVTWFVSVLEEYVFRNLLQKLLYTWFHYGWAIVITSLIFMSLHVPAYGGIAQNTLALFQPLAVVFGASVVLGYVYWRTENIVVPMVLHAIINTQALMVAVVLA